MSITVEEIRNEFGVMIYHSGSLDLGIPNFEPPKGYEITGIYTVKHSGGTFEISAVVKRKSAVKV
jgi:hypothetical protein